MVTESSIEQGVGATAEIAQWVSRAHFDDLPREVVHGSKRIICDSLACAIGARGLDPASMVIELATEQGGPSEATLMGSNVRVSAAAAAFANGYLGNALV
jgi:2-methylcitrate dehydratase PrpD